MYTRPSIPNSERSFCRSTNVEGGGARVGIISDKRQEFLGQAYYRCGHYFQRKGVRLHRMVWQHYNGAIPEGFHIHHIDGDRSNNQIENLELVTAKQHIGERHKHKRPVPKEAHDAAAKWHGSPEGHEWHKQQYQKIKDKILRRVPLVCTQCGQNFESTPGSKFCSNNCKAAWRRMSGVDDVTRPCSVCGRPFTRNKYYKIKTCSARCGAQLANIARSERRSSGAC